jgi:tetratricopeptide (TPR) repeat protein
MNRLILAASGNNTGGRRGNVNERADFLLKNPPGFSLQATISERNGFPDMNLRELLPQGKISDETLQALAPVFEGERLCKEGRYVEAKTKHLEALENFPPRSGGRFLVYNKLGIVYERLNRIEQAIEVYEKGVSEGTVTPFTYQRLSYLLLNNNRFPEAMSYCQKGLRCLKRAPHINLTQEIYFWLIFQRLKRKIKSRLPGPLKV